MLLPISAYAALSKEDFSKARFVADNRIELDLTGHGVDLVIDTLLPAIDKWSKGDNLPLKIDFDETGRFVSDDLNTEITLNYGHLFEVTINVVEEIDDVDDLPEDPAEKAAFMRDIVYREMLNGGDYTFTLCYNPLPPYYAQDHTNHKTSEIDL